MQFSLTWLPSVLRSAGLTVVEQPGWQTRGHGELGKIEGVLCHHTAAQKQGNAPSLKIVTEGRPDLSGPLAQLVLGRDGTFYVIAAGLAYHAGRGRWHDVIFGNQHFIGIEAENDGIGEPWPDVQMTAYAKGCAAIAKHCGFGAEMVAGHREYALPAGRKIDPTFDMVAFRQRVAGFMK